MACEAEGRRPTLVIGATGAVGSRLLRALAERHGGAAVVACVRRTPLSPELLALGIRCERGVDVRDGASLERAVRAHQPSVVWNLAAPLSVDTAADPAAAEDITVGGMRRLLAALDACGCDAAVCFSDSIGSFGASAPREGAPARWLVANPTQDPGSDYGLQKRGCRELLRAAAERGRDTRWAVIPGVLHADASWGGGTTEYALEAVACAARGDVYECPVPPDARLPMINAPDLVEGLLALQAAQRGALGEPEAGYAVAGFSFTPRELFAELERLAPGFAWRDASAGGGAAAKFAVVWPDSLSPEAARRDLGFAPRWGLRETVEGIFNAHRARGASEPSAKL
mmetsp:Transcript_2747/g.9666  ORF Transcript_2747/g.9666 Transcript_2747/m.9666 type:complete len:342 (+) Transcript_2747:82-1107(+)